MAVFIRKRTDVDVGKLEDGMTLGDAKKKYVEGLSKGTSCPCCGRYGQMYKVILNRSLVMALNWIAKAGANTPHGWVDVQEDAPKEILKARTYMKLVYWKLIQRKPSKYKDVDGSTGYWRVTDLGRQFLYGDIAVSKYVLVYNRKCEGMGGPQVFVSRCVKAQDIPELLQRQYS